MSTGDPLHRHDELHRGQVPTGQLADGAAAAGFAPISNGDGTVTWGPAGGGDCDHKHVTETFTAAGGSPETFTLSYSMPLYDRRVFLNGTRVTPSDVGGVADSVEVTTTLADVVVIDYEVACDAATPTTGTLSFPGSDVVYQGTDVNLLATIVTIGPSIISLILSAGLVSSDPDEFIFVVGDLASPDAAGLPPSVFVQGNMPNYIDGSAPGTFHAIAPTAGTWYVLGNYSGAYDGAMTGAGTWAVTYPTGTSSAALVFPGSDGSGSSEGNILATDTVAAASVVFVSLSADLPNNYTLGISGDVSGVDPNWGMYFQSDSGLPFPAAVWPLLLDPTDTSFNVHVYDFGPGGSVYDGGLSGSGTYEIVTLP